MVHGYHAIFGAYGYWLPNDPRGSWSDFVGAWELVRFGKATNSLERKQLDELTTEELSVREQAKAALKYPAVEFTDTQILAIGHGFAEAIGKSTFVIWACFILPLHVHLVIARHRFKVEQIFRLLKGAATKRLKADGLHPLSDYETDTNECPTPWADRKWKVFLDSDEAIVNAIKYVEDNPSKEEKPKQTWSFVMPYSGLDNGCVTYH